jgi:hypothetical protein
MQAPDSQDPVNVLRHNKAGANQCDDPGYESTSTQRERVSARIESSKGHEVVIGHFFRI